MDFFVISYNLHIEGSHSSEHFLHPTLFLMVPVLYATQLKSHNSTPTSVLTPLWASISGSEQAPGYNQDNWELTGPSQ